MPRAIETIAFAIAATMFHVGVAVIPKAVNVVPENQK
jgi:hypothetical protein